jgi:hypothetical protein
LPLRREAAGQVEPTRAHQKIDILLDQELDPLPTSVGRCGVARSGADFASTSFAGADRHASGRFLGD